MTGDDEFSLDAARRASAAGKLNEWVTHFLASPGSDNESLAAAFAFKGVAYLGPIQFQLERLTRMAGPEKGSVVVPIAEEEWEADVESMKESVERGWEPPPLLVSHRDGEFLLEDGNHRFETLRRSGADEAWAILAFADEAERDRFVGETKTRT